jgi:hypothetical protein
VEDRREVEGAMWDRKAIRVVRRAVFLKRDMFLCVFQSVRSGEPNRVWSQNSISINYVKSMEFREPPPPLAAGWVTKKNRAGTHYYFYNLETGEVS